MNTYYVAGIPYSSSDIYHHGILGQKWGIRRFQNKDGTRTAAGKERYSTAKEQKKFLKKVAKPYKGGLDKNKNFSKFLKDRRKIEKTGQVKQALIDLKDEATKYKDAMLEVDKCEEAFYNDNELYNKYLNISVDETMERWANKAGISRDEIKEAFLEGDLDQGHDGTVETFKRSGDPKAKALIDAEMRVGETYNALRDASMKYSEELLGKYSDTVLDKRINVTAKNVVSDIIVNASARDYWDNYYKKSK